MVVTLTFLHMPIEGAQDMVDHPTRLSQILRPPSQHLISHCSEAIDASRGTLCFLLIPRRSDPALLLHISKRPVDGAGVYARKTEFAQLFDQGIAMSRSVMKNQE
jgi:hypothetical protein